MSDEKPVIGRIEFGPAHPATPLRKLADRLTTIGRLSVFDLENLQIVANGCPAHPAYRARHGMDLPSCDVCAKVFAARASLTVAGLLQTETK